MAMGAVPHGPACSYSIPNSQPPPNGALMPSGGNAGFGFGDSAVDELNSAAAMAALVVLSALQSGAGCAQMFKRGPHVRLISANGLKTHGRDHCHQNHNCFQCFHRDQGVTRQRGARQVRKRPTPNDENTEGRSGEVGASE